MSTEPVGGSNDRQGATDAVWSGDTKGVAILDVFARHVDMDHGLATAITRGSDGSTHGIGASGNTERTDVRSIRTDLAEQKKVEGF